MALLLAEGLTKRFDGLVALSEVSLRVETGDIVGLIGPNGAGKTTLFSAISGFIRPEAGRCRFKDQDILGLPPNRICRLGMARTFQLVQPLAGLSVLENVIVGAFNRTDDPTQAARRAREVLEFVGLIARQHQLAGALTIADRKRLEVAKALATEPDLLLLDEVMSGLTHTEIDAVIHLVREIRARGVTVIVIEHVMRAIMRLADRIVVLHHGVKIAEGPPEAIARNPAVIEAYLGGGAEIA